MRGKMLWFNAVKGFGYIRTEEDERLYVHRTGFEPGQLPVGRCAEKQVSFERESADVEVEIDGADRGADRSSFANEAARAGFQVTFEQTLPPMAFKQGQVVGIFAAKRTLAEANALMQRLAPIGFRYIDIARSPTRWFVVMPQVPVKQALSIAREVSTAGFQITFRPGAQ